MMGSLILSLFASLFAVALAGTPKSFGIINVEGVGDVHVMGMIYSLNCNYKLLNWQTPPGKTIKMDSKIYWRVQRKRH